MNIGNPGEFTILELAEVIIRLTGSRSEIVYEALPQDDPTVRRPDIGLARELLGWEPTIELRGGPAPDPARDGRGGAASQLTRPSGPGGSPRATARSGRSTASICASSSGSASASSGPNGAGKTTTMRMLSCLAPRDRGELEVLGLDPDREPRRLKRMLGVVAQDTTLDLELTVRENLLVYARYFDVPRAEAATRADELLT